MLLQVSTAFVHDNKKGLKAEKRFRMGQTVDGSKISYLDTNMEKKIIEEKLKALQMQKATEIETTRAMKDLGIERAMLHGWPNTYVFTKAIGEMLLENFEKAKVVIIRPTIVTSTYKEGVRTMDSIFVAYGKGKLKFFVGDPNSTLDMILKWTNMMCCNLFESIYANARRRLSASMRLTELYKPYVFFQGVFDDVNTENLRRMIKEATRKLCLILIQSAFNGMSTL
ncbi:UNVERIFIED_CONTAM: putative fatty acyl-CoA reductase 4 [Sesamum angustifolium]|uniref:Fatty acyl-CoA reductase n=1 Tax=Sesamum angustifolium TaxID=2727405 RepID=A0AAW2QRA7_9LAMI